MRTGIARSVGVTSAGSIEGPERRFNVGRSSRLYDVQNGRRYVVGAAGVARQSHEAFARLFGLAGCECAEDVRFGDLAAEAVRAEEKAISRLKLIRGDQDVYL